MSDPKRRIFGVVLLLLFFAVAEVIAYLAGEMLHDRGVFYKPQKVDRYDDYLAKRDLELGWVLGTGMEMSGVDSAGSRIVPAFPEPGNDCMTFYGSCLRLPPAYPQDRGCVQQTDRRKQSGRGGYREGAGRKPVLNRARTITVTLEQADYEAVQDLAEKREDSFASVIRAALRAYLGRQKRS